MKQVVNMTYNMILDRTTIDGERTKLSVKLKLIIK